MLVNVITQLNIKTGYIAGTQNGIVTVAGQPVARFIYVFDALALEPLQRTLSLKNGHYLIANLDPTKQYLVMCRDLPPNGVDQRFEPICWDYVTPATDLTIAEQQALWQSWVDDVNSNTD